MRPLYIEGHGETWVELEAPALKISVPDRADQLFPVQRISRVIVSGGVQWQTDALLARADRGIKVTFLDDGGGIVARWLGKSGQRQHVMQRLADLIRNVHEITYASVRCRCGFIRTVRMNSHLQLPNLFHAHS